VATAKRQFAILLPCLLTGGTEVATLDTARAFLGLGFAVDVIVYFDEIDPVMRDTISSAGCQVIELGIHRNGGALTNILLGFALLKQLAIGRYSLVWLQYMTPTLLPLLLARLFTPRLMACVHVAGTHYTTNGIQRLRWLTRFWCNRFVCVSNTVAEGIYGSDWYQSIYASRVSVIPNSLDVEKVNAAAPKNWRQELGIEGGAAIIGYCGRLARIKGVDVLINAFALLLEMGFQAKLVVVGSGEERDNLGHLSNSLHLNDSLYFIGPLSHDAVYSAINGFDIAVVPSREEGFGLSALEAMAVGTPLVASDAGALPEVVVNNQTGLLFGNGSAAELAAKLAELLGQPDLRERLACSAKIHAADSYAFSRYQRRIAELLGSD